ncbi:MAG: hypothetical protein ISR58_04200 [Anaerolineales bacterium]|nr:hypothetical protein [Chloroflexota bacterium]MBL6980375.1 hypothetical protein [Anaerolineales bacterium]
MCRRTCQGELDLELLQDFNAAAIAETDGCGYLHPGDIPHRLFNGNKHFDPAEVMTIWEDGIGVAAWVLTSPRFKCYDAQVRPDLRGNDFEREVLEYADARTVELMHKQNIDADHFYTDAYQCDTDRSRLLLELGWKLENQANYMVPRASLDDVDEPVFPEGYTIRAVSGVEEAAAVAGVHFAAFPKAGWTPELFGKLWRPPAMLQNVSLSSSLRMEPSSPSRIHGTTI